MVIFLFCLAALAAANGANDVSRAAATLVGGRVTPYQRALYWAVAWTFAGSVLSGWLAIGVARRFAGALGTDALHLAIAVPSVLLASFLWIALSTYRGLPVATTHAIVGSLLGVTWCAGGWAACRHIDLAKGFMIPLIASPILATVCAGLVRKLVPKILDTRPRMLNRAHWISAGLTALSRGVNDSAKIWAILLPVAFQLTRSTQAIVAVAMLIGALVAGWRVTQKLAFQLSPMSCTDSVTANVVTATIIISASLMSFPVASSHVISGAILGVGTVSNRKALRWPAILEIVMAWLFTLPGTAIVSMGLYFGVRRIGPTHRTQAWGCIAAVLVILLLASLAARTVQEGKVSTTGVAYRPVSSLRSRLIVFVCNSNTSRSPMAAQICSSMLKGVQSSTLGPVTVLSRGISAVEGENMGPFALNALQQLNIAPRAHYSSNLNHDIVGKADLILCMTEAQVKQVVEAFPSSFGKISRLHPEIDIPNPAGLDQSAFEGVADLIAKSIGYRIKQIMAT